METIKRIVLSPTDNLRAITADAKGLWIPLEFDGREAGYTAQQIRWQLPHALEEQLARRVEDGYLVEYCNFATLFAREFTFPFSWSEWSPFRLSVSARFEKGRSGLSMAVSCFHGSNEIAAKRCGPFLFRHGNRKPFLMNEPSHLFLEFIDDVASGEMSSSLPDLLESVREQAMRCGVETRGLIARSRVCQPMVEMSIETAEESLDQLVEERTEIAEGGLTLSQFRSLSSSSLEAAAACLFDCHGHRAVLLPKGNDAGAPVAAVRDAELVLAHVVSDRVPSDGGLLEAISAAESSYRRSMRHAAECNVSTMVFSRTPLPLLLQTRLAELRIKVKADAGWLQELDAAGVTLSSIEERKARRFSLFGDALADLLGLGGAQSTPVIGSTQWN